MNYTYIACNHNYPYGADYALATDTIEKLACSDCGYSYNNTTTTYSVLLCGGYNA